MFFASTRSIVDLPIRHFSALSGTHLVLLVFVLSYAALVSCTGTRFRQYLQAAPQSPPRCFLTYALRTCGSAQLRTTYNRLGAIKRSSSSLDDRPTFQLDIIMATSPKKTTTSPRPRRRPRGRSGPPPPPFNARLTRATAAAENKKSPGGAKKKSPAQEKSPGGAKKNAKKTSPVKAPASAAKGQRKRKARPAAQSESPGTVTNVDKKQRALDRKAQRNETKRDKAAKAKAAHDAEVALINSPDTWAGLPSATLPAYDGMGDVNMNGLPTPTAVQQASIERLGFDWRIPPGQPVACSETRDEHGDYKLYLTLPLVGAHRIHRFVCPLCGLDLRPHSFPKHFGKGGKCEAKVLQPAVYQHVTETQKVGENV